MLERMAADRTPLYAEVADQVVDVDGKSPRTVADEIIAVVRVP